MTETVTSLRVRYPDAFTGRQQTHWLEIQLVDELNKPVSGISYKAKSEGLNDRILEGKSDADGLIRLMDLHWLDLTLILDAQQLADEMENRPLAISRPPAKPKETHKNNRSGWRSNVQISAEQKGYLYHYAVIGELCDQVPEIEKWDESTPPTFHFPDGTALKGKTISCEKLDQRHVIEICPFRAWILILHDTKEYALANGYNLGVLADMAYAKSGAQVIKQFFFEQCQNLLCTPRYEEYPACPHALVIDVPFRKRYTKAKFLDTSDKNLSEASAPLIDNTQLFYVENENHVIVAWRGTQEFPDLITDGTYSPQPCPSELADAGCIHGGFLDAYKLAKDRFEQEFKDIKRTIGFGKKLFICGHSLGGALGLTYAAEIKAAEPILYTYGMPRTFTANAVGNLHQIIHYRHINDTDTVTSVPFDANMDNWLYGKFGPLGSVLGFFWTLLAELPAQMAGAYLGEHYWHHGKPVVFFRTTQTNGWEECRVMMNPNTCRRLSYTLPAKARLFLVPSLSETENTKAKQAQETFISKYSQKDIDNIFPRNTNPSFDHMTNPIRHSMAKEYLPFLNNQLLESAWPELKMLRKSRREIFIRQMEQYAENTPKEELTRNRIFIGLQEELGRTLEITKALPYGENALTRFKAVAEEEIEIN